MARAADSRMKKKTEGNGCQATLGFIGYLLLVILRARRAAQDPVPEALRDPALGFAAAG